MLVYMCDGRRCSNSLSGRGQQTFSEPDSNLVEFGAAALLPWPSGLYWEQLQVAGKWVGVAVLAINVIYRHWNLNFL